MIAIGDLADYEKPIDLTAVITTLGGKKLNNTLECIKNSTILVSKILICVPRDYQHLVMQYENTVTSIVVTDEKGQVFQRIEGFKQVVTGLVLQLDDDLHFDTDAIEKVYKTARQLGPGYAVGGTINRLDRCSGKNNFIVNCLKIFQRKLLKLLVDAPCDDRERMGKYTKYTWCKLVPCNALNTNHIPVDFLPGGFCMSWQSDLVLENYFNLRGKAYKEDLLHSFERHKRGIRHIVLPSVVISTPEDLSIKSFRDLTHEFLASRWIGIRLGCHPLSLRLHLYIVLEIAYGVYRRLKLRRLSVRTFY